jgi:hypothetical protein
MLCRGVSLRGVYTLVDIKRGWKGLPRTNAIAYFVDWLATNKKLVIYAET